MPTNTRQTIRLGKVFSLAEQIQAFGLGRKTGELIASNFPQPAKISLLDGEVVDAQFGPCSGLEAAIVLINLADIDTVFILDEPPLRKTIELPFMQILCEAARVKDELERGDLKATTSGHVLRVRLGQEQEFALPMGLTRIGRSITNNIVIRSPSVSQKHAAIEVTPAGAYLKDVGAMNGVYASGVKVRQKWLVGQEVLAFGEVVAIYMAPVVSEATEKLDQVQAV